MNRNWIQILYRATEEDLTELQGTDLTLYLKFLKTCAIIFLVLTVLNSLGMIPLYITGEPKED